LKKISLAGWILIGLVAGAATGFLVGPGIEIIKPIGTLFLRLLKMTIYPLIFFSIAGDIAGIADLKRLRKVGTTFIGYWAVASVLAASVGLMFAKLIKPDQRGSSCQRFRSRKSISICSTTPSTGCQTTWRKPLLKATSSQ